MERIQGSEINEYHSWHRYNYLSITSFLLYRTKKMGFLDLNRKNFNKEMCWEMSHKKLRVRITGTKDGNILTVEVFDDYYMKANFASNFEAGVKTKIREEKI